jgi:hypothetical protein
VELAQRKRGWQDLNEKSEMIAKLLSSYDGACPTFHAAVSFQASPAGLVDIMVEEVWMNCAFLDIISKERNRFG